MPNQNGSVIVTEGEIALCLIAGWWGLARHFHYLPEIIGAFCWTVPILTTPFLPYFYVVFLTLLLTDRAFRDDVRCQSKYGSVLVLRVALVLVCS